MAYFPLLQQLTVERYGLCTRAQTAKVVSTLGFATASR
jgi:hypothetical protein